MIGATVMPHNLYLHSSLVQTRKFERSKEGIQQALKYNFIDSVIALNLAFFVNAAILILAAATFYKNGLFEVAEIQDAYRFLEPIAEFTEVIDQTQSAVASLRRVLGVLDTPIGPPQPTMPIVLPKGDLSIDFVDVSFAYGARLDEDDDTPVLNSINLHVPGGQHIALVGPSGSGKTTLARLIARLADPTMGMVMLGGVPLHRVNNDDLRSRLIVVPQEPFLFANSIAYNLRFASPNATDDQLRSVFSDLEIDDWLDALPQGINTNVGQRGGSLSAGERQLIALVRAAVVRPDVLILDEATSSVDALTEVRISKALTKLAQGRTTVSIAHRLSTAARADRVILLERGRIVEDGSHHQLIAAQGPYAKQYETWVTSTQSNLD